MAFYKTHRKFKELLDFESLRLEAVENDLDALEPQVVNAYPQFMPGVTRLRGFAQKVFELLQSAKITPHKSIAVGLLKSARVRIVLLEKAMVEKEKLLDNFKRFLHHQKRRNSSVRTSQRQEEEEEEEVTTVEHVCSLWDAIVDAIAPLFVKQYTRRCSR